MRPNPSRQRGNAFTLVELLVVIGIIVVLLSILIPAVVHIQKQAKTAATKAFLSNLSQAIDTYNAEQRAYPGPLSNNEVRNASALAGWNGTGSSFAQFDVATAINPAIAQGYDTGWKPEQITMAENLVLGLLGGLRLKIDGSGNVDPTTLYYDPTLVGNGPNSLNITGARKSAKAYLEVKNLPWRDVGGKKSGHWVDEGGEANDSIIPEFVDAYSDPLPYLYLRARKGARLGPGQLSTSNNLVITYTETEQPVGSPLFRVGQFDLRQIIGYTGSTIGAGRKLGAEPVGWTGSPIAHGLRKMDADSYDKASMNPSATGPLKYRLPYDAYPYLRNTSLSSPSETDPAYTAGQPRIDVPYGKDGYILISAGPDRIYGTRDDVTTFGEAGPR